MRLNPHDLYFVRGYVIAPGSAQVWGFRAPFSQLQVAQASGPSSLRVLISTCVLTPAHIVHLCRLKGDDP